MSEELNGNNNKLVGLIAGIAGVFLVIVVVMAVWVLPWSFERATKKAILASQQPLEEMTKKVISSLKSELETTDSDLSKAITNAGWRAASGAQASVKYTGNQLLRNGVVAWAAEVDKKFDESGVQTDGTTGEPTEFVKAVDKLVGRYGLGRPAATRVAPAKTVTGATTTTIPAATPATEKRKLPW